MLTSCGVPRTSVNSCLAIGQKVVVCSTNSEEFRFPHEFRTTTNPLLQIRGRPEFVGGTPEVCFADSNAERSTTDPNPQATGVITVVPRIQRAEWDLGS